MLISVQIRVTCVCVCYTSHLSIPSRPQFPLHHRYKPQGFSFPPKSCVSTRSPAERVVRHCFTFLFLSVQLRCAECSDACRILAHKQNVLFAMNKKHCIFHVHPIARSYWSTEFRDELCSSFFFFLFLTFSSVSHLTCVGTLNQQTDSVLASFIHSLEALDGALSGATPFLLQL